MSQTALITGASGGIGYELAKIFAKEKWNLILVARTSDRLREIQQNLSKDFGIKVTVLVKDLAQPNAAEEVYREVQKQSLAVDVLVNNAGFGAYGPFSQIGLKVQMEMIALNITTLTHLARLFLPEMIRRKRGRILNVASTAAFQPGPLMAVYYATKAYVLSFSEALASELRNSGVTVTCLCPGFTESEFQKHANLKETALMKIGKMNAGTVARIGYRGLMQGKSLVIAGRRNHLLAFAARLGPRKLVTWIVHTLQAQRLKENHETK